MSPRVSVCPSAYRTCGWTPDTPARTRVLWLGGESALGWRAEIVRHPPKPAPEEVMMRWAREWAKEGVDLAPKKFMRQKGHRRPFLPKRWIVERTFCWLSQNRRLSKDYERLPESSEAFIYVAMRAA
jgi:transposase